MRLSIARFRALAYIPPVTYSPKTIRQAFYDAIALEEMVLEDEIADKNARQLLIDEKIAINDINHYLKTVIDAIPQ